MKPLIVLHGAEFFLRTNRFSASQEIPRILWDPKVHYRLHKWQTPVPILSHIDPFHIPTSLFLKIYLNIILPSMPGFSKCSLSRRFPHQNPVYTSPLTLHATCPAHRILLDFITRTILGEVYRSLSSSLCIFIHFPVISSLLSPNILLNTLFSNTLSLGSLLNVRDQVSHRYNTTGKIIVLYILILKYLDSKLEDKNSAPNDSKHSLFKKNNSCAVNVIKGPKSKRF